MEAKTLSNDKEHIPISKLQESCMWDNIVGQQKNQLIEEIKS